MINSTAELCELLGVPFSDEQLAAITAPLGPYVIVAGAGTGKTTVMAARVAWLVGTGQVKAEEVLGLTFTRKAAGELSDRVAAALEKAGFEEPDFQVQTYDSFSASIVSEHGLRLGFEANQKLITGAARYRVGARVVADTELGLQPISDLTMQSIVERMLSLDANLCAHLASVADVKQTDREFDLAIQEAVAASKRGTKKLESFRDVIPARAAYLDLVAEYRELKANLHVTEFADQMVNSVTLAQTFSSIRSAIREKFKVVLLDEYQDTSAAQAILLSTLFSGPTPADGRGHPVTAVGDPFQAIYGWRGAAPANILAFPKIFPCADGSPAPTLSLTINRRSRGLILTAANQISAPLLADPRLSAGVPERRLRSPDGNQEGLVRISSFNTWQEEVDWLADAIIEAHEGGLVPWSQIAVLTRNNSAIGALCTALIDRDVPVEIVGVGGLLEIEEIDQIVATLTILEDPTANTCVVRLLSGRRWRVSPRDLAVLASRAKQLATKIDDADRDQGASVDDEAIPSLLEAIADPGPAKLSDEARKRLKQFNLELVQLRRHLGEPVTDLIHRVITASGVRLELASDPRPRAAIIARQIDKFLDEIAGYVDIDGDGSLAGLLAWLEAERDLADGLTQALDVSDDSVKLMTAHRSKGLEWDLVFIPGLVDGGFPSNQPPENWTKQAYVVPAELRGDAEWVPQLSEVSTKELDKGYPGVLRDADRQAEDRLAYVAVTRARRELVLTYHHWSPGRKTMYAPSFYVETLRRMVAESQPGTLKFPDGSEITAPQGIVLEHIAQPTDENPTLLSQQIMPWPLPADPQWGAAVHRGAELVQPSATTSTSLDLDEQTQAWRGLAKRLLAERANQASVNLRFPSSISATSILLGKKNPQLFRDQLLRPMPRQPLEQASVGTQFHSWLEERFGHQGVLDLEFEQIAEPDPDSNSEKRLRILKEKFESGPYADQQPIAVEESFILNIGGVQIRGKIDAVFATPDDPKYQFKVVDWKTFNGPADPLQLAIYRLGWAKAKGIPPQQVDTVYHHVESQQDERPTELLDEAGLASLLSSMDHKLVAMASLES